MLAKNTIYSEKCIAKYYTLEKTPGVVPLKSDRGGSGLFGAGGNLLPNSINSEMLDLWVRVGKGT